MSSGRVARHVWLLGALLGVNNLSAIDNAPVLASVEPLTSLAMTENGVWDYRLDGAGKLWLAYYDQDRKLRLRGPEGEERLLLPGDRDHAPSGLGLAALDRGGAVLWRDKLPVKGLYLLDTAQPGMQPLELGGDTQPLARIVAAPGQEGLLHLLWYGEKRTDSPGGLYNLYYRNWNARTQALSPIESLMPGIYPVISTDAAGGVMVYSWLRDEKTYRIASRYRTPESGTDVKAGTFGEAVTVAEIPEITPVFDSFRSGNRWFVVWVAQYGADRRDYLVEGAHSDDQGKSWKRFAFEDLRGFDIGSLRVAADDSGHILLALSAKAPSEDAKTKEDVLVIRSADRGETWSSAERIRHRVGPDSGQDDQPDASLSGFRALDPSVAIGNVPGQVLMVWEDWRDIRSGLYASLSTDYGQTWTLDNVPLSRDSGKNLGLRHKPNAVYASGDGFQVIAEQSTDDGFKTKQLVRLSLTAADLARYAKSAESSANVDPKVREESLRKRAEGFWQAMVAKDYQKTYEYQDPFFRARMTPLKYLSNMGRINYASAQVSDIRIDGPKAEVTTTIRASVPAFRVPSTGEMVSQPEREVAVKNTWLWLDGDWHREFQIESQEIIFTRY